MGLLLERERELGELKAALDEVMAGKGGAVAVEAGAGLGKTRLLQEARGAAAAAGLNVLSGRATELERDFPFALARQLLETEITALPADERERVLEGASAARGALGLDPASDRDHDTFAVLHGLYWVTAALAERKPLLLAIDDAHTADAASLDYLGFLLPRLEELPVLLVVTGRPDEPDPSGGFRRLMTDPQARHMTLDPLSAEATTALLAQELDREPRPPFAAACFEVSGGNPFLLRELARTLAQRDIEPLTEHAEQVRELVPERVAQTVLMRIQRLSSEAQALVRCLAVLGDGGESRFVAELAELDPEEISKAADELRASSVLDGGATLRFIHPLARNAVYADIPTGERAQAHLRAAALLREHEASPEQISTQLLASEGRGDREAVEKLIEAGERALASGAPRSAIAYLSRALREPPPPELRAAILQPLIIASSRAADQSAWAEIEADVLAELERDPALRSRWAVPLTVAMSLGGHFEEAAAILKEAVELAVAEGEVERAFQLEAQLRTMAMLAPSLPSVDLSRYFDQIDPHSPAGRLAAAMEAGSAVAGGSAEEAAEAAKRALADDAVILVEEPELVAATLALLALVLADELDAARKAIERAHAIAQARDATPELVRSWFCSGFLAWASGDFPSAEADMRQAINLARLAGILPLALIYSSYLIEILIERDEMEEAEALLQATGLASGPIPENVMFAPFQLIRTHLRFERGEMEETAEDFLAIADQTERLGIGDGPLGIACLWGIRALVAIGECERAEEMAGRGMVFARRWGAAGLVAHVMRGVAATKEGAEKVALLEEAAATADGSLGLPERAHALLELGEALRRDGHRAKARGPLRGALEQARRCGMVRVAKRANDELQASGEKVRRYTPIGVESLTPSERRVAELAASGMTNRQIAQHLFVTVKTVEAHLSAAYDKLDIDSRRQLPAALASRDRPKICFNGSGEREDA
jgi:DNA-binding CsgD family transcriptional regulator